MDSAAQDGRVGLRGGLSNFTVTTATMLAPVRGLVNIAKEVMYGTVAYGDALECLLYNCTACGVCDVNCKCVRDMEVLDTIYALRAGCAAFYRHHEIAMAAIKILRTLDIPFHLLRSEEWCCGAMLWRSGQNVAAAEEVGSLTPATEQLGPLFCNYHLWLRKLRKAFDPNDLANPVLKNQ